MNRFLSTTSLPRQAPEARMNPLSDSMSQSTGLRRVAAAVRTPFLAICRLDAPRTLRAPSACQQYLGQEQQPAGYSARGPESHGLLPLGSPFSPAGPSFNKGKKLGKRVACIRHHRLRLSATIFYSSGTLAGHRRCVIRPEARGAGATRIPTASNQTRDQG